MKHVNEPTVVVLTNSAVTYDDDKGHTTHFLDDKPTLSSSFSQDPSSTLPKSCEIDPAETSATCFMNYSSPRHHKSLNDLSEDDGKVQKNLLHKNSRGCMKEPL
uniref:Uncharacterized protein n=1 Tax=Proboscia inermis TaxID=420281 RepID=A0A7S0GFV3_9STRA